NYRKIFSFVNEILKMEPAQNPLDLKRFSLRGEIDSGGWGQGPDGLHEMAGGFLIIHLFLKNDRFSVNHANGRPTDKLGPRRQSLVRPQNKNRDHRDPRL